MSAASMDSLHLLILLVLERSLGCDYTLYRRWWLGAHAAIHGLRAAFLPASFLLGRMQALLHAFMGGLKIRCFFTPVLIRAVIDSAI